MYPSLQCVFTLYLATVHFVYSTPKLRIHPALPALSSGRVANLSSLHTANTGLGSNDDPLPKEFKVRGEDIGPQSRPMSESATFINVVQLINVLGKQDFSGEIRPFRFNTAQYPSPIISLGLPPSQTIKRAYVIWGLQIAMNDMYTRPQSPQFQTSHYSLEWNEEIIGGIFFGLPLPGGERFTQITDQKTPVLEMSDLANLSTDVTNNRLSVAYTYIGGELNKIDLFNTLLWAMSDASRPASNARVPADWTPPSVAVYGLHTTFLVSAARRITAPLMTYFWLLDALAGAASYFVDHGKYAELRMQLAVEGAPIGDCLFRHRSTSAMESG
ncbi:MAG: hypothetical protein LQ337_004570 [Flavoplaca oasis]|nr:MAG: hypothetical protein LQ337_004570 [Flavoplaca oasis]